MNIARVAEHRAFVEDNRACPEETPLRIVSWNVDGLNRQELDVLLDHVTGSMEWEILMLQ